MDLNSNMSHIYFQGTETRAYVLLFKEQKKNHLRLSQDVKLMNTI